MAENPWVIDRAASLNGHQNPIFAVENGPEITQLYTAGNDKGIVEWNMESLKFVRVLCPVSTSVYTLHHIGGTHILAVGERSGLVSLIDTRTGMPLARLSHHQLPVFAIKSFKHKPELLVSSEDGTVSVWNLNDFKLLYHFRVSTQTVRSIAISTDERYLVFGDKSGELNLYHAHDYSLVRCIWNHQMGITSLCFSPDGHYLLSGGRDAQLNVFDTLNFSLQKNVTAHLFSIYGIGYHPVLPIFATASRDKSIKLWSAFDFRLLRVISFEKGFDSHLLSINNIIWNPYSNQLVSVSDDKKAMVWNVNVVMS